MTFTLNIKALIFFVFILFNAISAKSQSGTLKSKNGFLLFANTDSMHFTLRLDEPNSQIPLWINKNRLQLFKDQMYLQYFEKSSIIKSKKDKDTPLNLLQKWETTFIKSIKKPTDKSPKFISDNDSMSVKSKDFNTNSWYYSVDITSSKKMYFYFFDIYKNGYFIRIEYMGGLGNARFFIKTVFNFIRFYKKDIDIPKLQSALKLGEYYYDEN